MLDKISNEKEYVRALDRIEQLMFKVVPGSPEGEELEKLSKLVEQYENKQSVFLRSDHTKFDKNDLLDKAQNMRKKR
ncbi:MAG: hypothetical protein K2N67_01130 [Mucispirillum sp.]|nr:hypothetical protein [Mucispirillum sp.]